MSNTQGVISSISLSARVRPAAHVLGIRGGGWNAIVNERGSIRFNDGSPVLDWHIAADDRWHDPSTEPSVRQTRRAGVPVVETRLRIPGGDAIQRVYAVADAGGLVVIEITNESTLPIAVAFTRSDVVSSRTPSPRGAQGIELPAGSVVFPVAHGSTLRVAVCAPLNVANESANVDVERLPSFEQLQKGWLKAVEQAGYVIVPEGAVAPLVARLRSDALILSGHEIEDWAIGAGGDCANDPVAYILTLQELLRMGEKLTGDPAQIRVDHAARLAQAVETLLKENRKSSILPWDVERALFAAQFVFSRMGENRAADDVAAAQLRMSSAAEPPNVMPTDIRAIAWVEEKMVAVQRDGSVQIFGRGIPRLWLGANLECHRVSAGALHTVSFGIRWHGEKPALLWEVSGPAGVKLDAGLCDPTWSSVEPTGETLLLGFAI
ncbi:unannotated protein [freshwater metagenome]|jgi:hypothetical protein|uniref:Unannotated protein n=1 Tax=freshwater metagenome TaxID=449393 RepID=A0A6J7KK63_9ZZZZ|nr:hypothetical protein [Actinomycetota bacterium]MSW48601.1 hypothetical protein [Actinomycetota bacterium]